MTLRYVLILFGLPWVCSSTALASSIFEEGQDCEVFFADTGYESGVPQSDAIGFLERKLGVSSSRNLLKRELELLFSYRGRLKVIAPQAGEIQSPDLAKLIGQILGKPITPQDRFTQKELDDQVLLKAFVRIVFRIAHNKKKTYPQADLDDLVQEGMVGLLHAYEEYSADSKYMFSTIAEFHVTNAMDDVLRSSYPGISVSTQRGFYRYSKIIRIRNDLKRRLLREPTIDEIVAEHNLIYSEVYSAETVKRAIEKVDFHQSVRSWIRVDGRGLDSDERGASPWLVEAVTLARDGRPTPEISLEIKQSESLLSRILLENTPKQHRHIIQQYVGIEARRIGSEYLLIHAKSLSLSDISERFQLPKEKIKEILSETKTQLQRAIKDAGPMSPIDFNAWQSIPKKRGPKSIEASEEPRWDIPEEALAWLLRS